MVHTVAEIEPEERTSGGPGFAARPRRVGIVADYLEERWPSMDLAAELTSLALERYAEDAFEPTLLRPSMPRLLRRFRESKGARNADRYIGRYVAYPRWLRKRARGFDLFHVIDQSYAHLVNVLPARRTVVTCHDLDAFRSLIGEEREDRPLWFRRTMHTVLRGFRSAARVICDSETIRASIEEQYLIPSWRLSVVPLPVHPDFSPDPDLPADREAARLLGPAQPGGLDLLHVGINIPRKRLGFLLRLFAAIRERHPNARLIRAGGALGDDQLRLADTLGLPRDAIVELPFISRPVLAAVYRRATVLLATSKREGFGWPLVEAMACGTPVVASDLAVFREVGGEAVTYAPVRDMHTWVDVVDRLLRDRADPREWKGRREAALERADAFSLESYARGVIAVYRHVLGMKEG
ncbi:MAG TPA: glycosyltransferase family 1 protein [Longimicrobium sp.]|nr:glycosyltransferase family 1 protein [Longimicrobium sp.]